jgi:hypothetical protein
MLGCLTYVESALLQPKSPRVAAQRIYFPLSSREVVGPALLLWPVGVVGFGVDFKLLLVCVHDFLAAVLALRGYNQYMALSSVLEIHTIEVGFGGLTGLPFGLTATRVPAASPFF